MLINSSIRHSLTLCITLIYNLVLINAYTDADQHLQNFLMMRYGEGIRGSRQFWMAQRYELSDLIKQIGHQGLIFFTFSVADLHWPDLHKLMPRSTNEVDELELAKK